MFIIFRVFRIEEHVYIDWRISVKIPESNKVNMYLNFAIAHIYARHEWITLIKKVQSKYYWLLCNTIIYKRDILDFSKCYIVSSLVSIMFKILVAFLDQNQRISLVYLGFCIWIRSTYFGQYLLWGSFHYFSIISIWNLLAQYIQ